MTDEPDDEEGVAPPYLNRQLSWLDYGARVLCQAEDPTVPLLERAKFLAIFSQNLDEFFQVRVAGLKDQVEAGLGATGADGLGPEEQLAAIRAKVSELLERQYRAFLDDVVPALSGVGIGLSDWDSLDDDDREYLVGVFEERIFPVLTPLCVDPAHPFPEISNLSLNLAVVVRNPVSGERRFARVKVPPLLPRFVVMSDGERFVPLEQVIAHHLPSLFVGMEIEEHYSFRVTRNADLTLEEDEADDLLAAVELELRRRRFGEAVRLEIDRHASSEIRDLLIRELEIRTDDVYDVDGPLDLGGLWSVWELDRRELKDEAWAPMTQPGLATADDEPVDIFAALRERDILVHHPYDSFATSTEAFIQQAADDPRVLAIKQTLYRTSGDSPVVKALIHAAELGKQVAVLVELKARFDEQANIGWARALEDAGVHVVYGLVGLKTHAKAALVVRDEDDGIRRYCHIGTGNYNSKTARIYEDFGLLSADPLLAADLTELFNFLTGYSRQLGFRRIFMAPISLRTGVIDLIDEQAKLGPDGRIIIKINNLADQAIIDALYRASQAGVRVDLIVRSVCGLVPGVPGLSDTIEVRSILGRYLEHSRVFVFGEPGPDASYFIGSSDLMPGNLDRRIEAMTPVADVDLKARLQEVIDIDMATDVHAWRLLSDGTWERLVADGASSQRRLQDLALVRARRRRDPDALASSERT
jgi:polyphosphate kinase